MFALLCHLIKQYKEVLAYVIQYVFQHRYLLLNDLLVVLHIDPMELGNLWEVFGAFEMSNDQISSLYTFAYVQGGEVQ